MSTCGGIQPQTRSVTSTVLWSGRSPAAQLSRGSWRATVSTRFCSRVRAVASAEVAPAIAPPAVTPTACSETTAGVGGGVAMPADWRTTAGWPTPPLGLAGADDGAAGGRLAGAVGAAGAAGAAGRMSAP
ncbi:hypothetical protein E2F47_26040 [Mycobacterium eburneum]|nr:hypothetical protein E2F47_26040 [Mycobacterium eburneum]